MERFSRWRIAAVLGAISVVLAQVAIADAIEGAGRYTVKVRTTTPVPFVYDKGRGGGAGFLVDRERGWIVTNRHVAGYGPSDVQISFRGSGFLDAQVRYVDPHLDLALLEVDPDAIAEQARTAPLACERRPRAGEAVVAFGHPWNLDYTATRGIVSGVATRWDRQWIQTDAPLNSGNSGGPLISIETGEVVGINTASMGGEEVQNLNFAVPMRQACPVLALLRQGVDPTPARLPVTVAVREHGDGGRVIARVPKSVDADLRPGDRIVTVGTSRQAPANQTELYRHLRRGAGSIALTVERGGEELTRQVGLIPVEPVLAREGLMVAGVLFAPASVDLARAEGDPRLMVHWVKPGTAGSVAGFHVFDLVEAVDGQPVDTLAELRAVVEPASAGEELRVVHRRLVSNGGTWWTYSERLLPARPVRHIARAE